MFQSLSSSIEELAESHFYLVNTVNEKQTNVPWSRLLKGPPIFTKPVIQF